MCDPRTVRLANQPQQDQHRNLLADLGEEDSDWVGQTVEVCAGEVETKNGPTDALLVRAADTKPKSAKSVSKPGKSDMDDEIPF
jgi:hypothetical protein